MANTAGQVAGIAANVLADYYGGGGYSSLANEALSGGDSPVSSGTLTEGDFIVGNGNAITKTTSQPQAQYVLPTTQTASTAPVSTSTSGLSSLLSGNNILYIGGAAAIIFLILMSRKD